MTALPGRSEPAGQVAVERPEPVRTSRALCGAARTSRIAGIGRSWMARPSISALRGALAGSVATRTMSLPSSTSDRSGLPWVASGVTTMASSDGATAGPPAPTL